MINPETRKLLEQMSSGPYGRALSEYLYEEMKEIRDVEKVESWEDALANKKVVKIVNKLFSFLEKKTVEVDKPKNQYK